MKNHNRTVPLLLAAAILGCLSSSAITGQEAQRRWQTQKQIRLDKFDLVNEGFRKIAFNQPSPDPLVTDVVIGCHSVGNSGHGIGPSIAFFNPARLQYTLRPSNLLSIELFAYTSAPEWNGAKVRIPLEDDAVLTERGIEWLYPVNQRILLIR